MLVVETIARIRRKRFIKGKTIKEIARDLKVSRNTVRKVLRSGETSFEYERVVQPRPKLGRWAAELDMLRKKLRADRLMVAAQVHSHPQEAFHSKADDTWAIVRHEGALSLVVPRFARDTSLANFVEQTKVFRFSDRATWDEVPRAQVFQECLRIL
uniref:Mov34/MPN/PAD-1 family protein n=1 Tax=Bradyrhizobium septentrionale TaxID=1404411 RepID=A0A973WAT3_9BRAD